MDNYECIINKIWAFGYLAFQFIYTIIYFIYYFVWKEDPFQVIHWYQSLSCKISPPAANDDLPNPFLYYNWFTQKSYLKVWASPINFIMCFCICVLVQLFLWSLDLSWDQIVFSSYLILILKFRGNWEFLMGQFPMGCWRFLG